MMLLNTLESKQIRYFKIVRNLKQNNGKEQNKKK